MSIKNEVPITPRTVGYLGLQIAIILAAELLNAWAFKAIIVPNKLLSGGVVGLALLLNQVFKLPIGLQVSIYNIPIFLLGWRFLGRRFAILSIIGVVSFSFFTDNLFPPTLIQDPLLVAVFGGLTTGIADGIIMRTGGSTGGTDILGLIVSRRFGLSTGQVFLVFNGIIIALGARFNGLELAMYTLIMLFVSTRTLDGFLRTTPRPVALIISPKHDLIATELLHDLGRGVTYLQGVGAYTSVEYRVLMCVMTRYELVELRNIVHRIDPNAFTIVLDASDIIGNFEHVSPLQRLFR